MDTVSNPAIYKTRDSAIALKSDGNPEGKGVSGFLLDWEQSKPLSVTAKPQRRILAEFFTSMLVLSANFKYKPVVGKPNYLYWQNNEWRLSLVAPEEWSGTRHAWFAGTCELQLDRTWTIDPSDTLAEDNAVSQAVARFYDAFAEMMDTDLTLEEILPFFVRKMPYYQRLNASSLSRSLRSSMILGDQTSIRCRDWHRKLPGVSRLLLPGSHRTIAS
ncbi:MAG: DUF2452 domain-containing protein [Woeseia sp.]